jgi:hypothetical protein
MLKWRGRAVPARDPPPKGPEKTMRGAGRHCLRNTSSIERGIAFDLDATMSASSTDHDHWQRSHGIGCGTSTARLLQHLLLDTGSWRYEPNPLHAGT